MSERWDALVIGGGFYGLYLAEFLAARYNRVLLCEREGDLMQRASYANQARVHNGYHYPRSLLTAFRSRVNFPRFVEEFGPCINSSFENYYAIGARYSKVSAGQFFRLMRRIGAPIDPAPAHVRRLFDRDHIEDVFLTREYAFNSKALKGLMSERVQEAGVQISLRTEVSRLRQAPGDAIELDLWRESGAATVLADHVYCCAYSQTNATLERSGLKRIPLKHELVEMALVEPPPELRGCGVTVMCGPFFSCLPFPPRGVHTLSHVRYTPHIHWFDSDPGFVTPYDRFAAEAKATAFPHMVRDASLYVPSMRTCRQVGSLWEVKTVLPQSETDDSRPILFRPHYGLRNHHVVLGGKIDNVYDVVDKIREVLPERSGSLHVEV